MYRLIVPFIACMTAAAVVAQPYSESMADCAALHQNAAQWVQSDETAERLMGAANAWAAAAVAQAEREGRTIPKATMWEKIDAKTDAWEAKGPQLFQSSEFADWTAYCKRFARNQGINTGL